MTDLRKAAEMVCDGWENDVDSVAMDARVKALRQALAQPEQERLYTEKDIVAVVEAIVASFDLRRSKHLRHLIEAKLKEKNSG